MDLYAIALISHYIVYNHGQLKKSSQKKKNQSDSHPYFQNKLYKFSIWGNPKVISILIIELKLNSVTYIFGKNLSIYQNKTEIFK